jgi:hypothetical protein
MPRLSKPIAVILALAGFLLALEVAVPLWRNDVPVSHAAVFTLPMANEAMRNPGKFQTAIEAYRADRGGELKVAGPADTSLTVFYFEWEQVESSAIMGITGHRPEQCNVGAGFKLQSHNPRRVFEAPDHSSLVFDNTSFSDPMGRNVYVFKIAWIQGLGSWDIRENENRTSRLVKSFRCGRGAARVLECGVTGARDEAHAWQIFKEQVLDQLVWSDSKPVT